MTITLPDYRAQSRNKTAFAHWRSYQKFRNEVCELVAGYTGYKKHKAIENAEVTISAYYKGKRSVDTSNIDDKIFVDALMHIGVLKDDDPLNNPRVIKQAFQETGENKVIITVRSLPCTK